MPSFFQGDGRVELFCRTVGEASRVVVALHGGPGCDSTYLVPDLTRLASSNRVVFYDQRGSGRSDLPADPGQLTIADHVRDLEALRTHLELGEMVLLGHSFGALLAAYYAIAHPERVAGMILLGPLPPRQSDLWPRFSETIDARLGPEAVRRLVRLRQELVDGDDPRAACREYWSLALEGRLAEPSEARRLIDDLCSSPAESIRHGLGTTYSATMDSLGDWDLRAELAQVRAPTLVVHGDADAIPFDLVEEWTGALPDCRLLRVRGAAHFPHVERPDIVWPEIERFLAGLAG